VTGVLSGLMGNLRAAIAADKMGKRDESLKFFFYSDHDDSIVMLANAFKFNLDRYPPFAT